MYKLFAKIVLLIFVVLMISKVVRVFFSHLSINRYTEAPDIFFEEVKEECNTIFLGASRPERGINPVVFDKIANQHFEINSFNYCLGGASTGEVYEMLSYLLSYEPPKLTYLLVEIQSVRNSVNRKKFFGVNKRTIRNKYWVDWEQLQNMFSLVDGLETNLPYSKKTDLKFKYVNSFVENQLNVGMYERFVESLTMPNERVQNYTSAGFKKGYFPLELEPPKSVGKRHENFLASNPKQFLKSQAKASSMKYEVKDFNQNHLDILEYYIQKAEEKNIRIIYLFPHIPYFFDELQPIYKALPAKNKINISNGSLYPELYQVNYYFDGNHLNGEGANVYSKILAENFIKNLQQYP